MANDVLLRIRSENLTAKDFRQVRDDLSRLNTLSKQQAEGLRRTASAETAVARASQAKIRVQRESEKLTQDQLRTEALREAALRRSATEERRVARERETQINKEIRLAKQRLNEERRVLKDALTFRRTQIREEQKAQRATERSVRATRSLGSAWDFARANLAALSAEMVIFSGLNFARDALDAAVAIDSNTRALAVFTGGIESARERVRELQELSDQPGLTFQQAVRGELSLRALGKEAELTTRILTELANASAFSGGQGEFERGLVGLRQTLARGRLSQEELNQITENITIASRVLQSEFSSVLAEDIQAQLDAAGQDIDDFVERLLTGFERLERFPLDAASVKLKNLTNSIFELKAEVGATFEDAISDAAVTLTTFTDAAGEAFRGERPFEALIADIAEVDAGLARLVEGGAVLGSSLSEAFEGVPEDLLSIASSLASITGNIATLTGALLELEAVGDVFRTVFGLDAIEALDNLLQLAAAGTDEFTGFVTGRGSNAFEEFNAERLASSGNTATFAQVGVDINAGRSASEIQNLIDTYTSLKEVTEATLEESRIFLEAGLENPDRVKELESAVANYTTKITELNTELGKKAEVTAKSAEADENAAAVVDEVLDAYVKQTELARQARENLDKLSEAQEILNTFWQVASGQLEDYASQVQIIVPSVINLTEAEKAYTDAIVENNAIIALALFGETKQITSRERAIEVYKQAEREIKAYETANLNASQAVAESDARIQAFNNTAIAADADINAATERLRDFDEAFQGPVATIPRLTSAMQRFTGTLADLDASPVLENLPQQIIAARREAELLASSVRSIDTFADSVQLTSPGGGQSGLDVIGQGAGYGDAQGLGIGLSAELISEAISLIGNLRRAEEERAESLVALEAQTSERIQAINQRKADQLHAISRRIYEFEKQTAADIRQAFIDARNAEIDARLEAANAIYDIEQRASEQRGERTSTFLQQIADLQEKHLEDVQSLRDAFNDREERRQERIIEIQERATDERLENEKRYNDEVQGIYNSVVDAFNAAEERKTDIKARAAEARADAEKQYQDEVQGIYNSVVDAFNAAEERKTDIKARAAEARADAEKQYQDEVQGIYNSVVDAFNAAEERRIEILNQTFLRIVERAGQYRDEVQGIYNSVVDAFNAAEERKTDIKARAAEARSDAEKQYGDEVQGVYNSVAEAFFSAQEQIGDILDRAAERRLDAERTYNDRRQDIINSVVEDIRALQDQITQIDADAEAERERIREDAADRRLDAEERYADSVLRLQENLGREIERIQERRENNELRRTQSIEDLETQTARRQADLLRELNRDLADSPDRAAELTLRYERALEDLSIQSGRRREDLDLRHRRDLAALDQAETSAREQAGVDPIFLFSEEGVTAFEQLGITLQKTLDAIGIGETSALSAVDTQQTADVSAVEGQITDIEETAGITFVGALREYTPPMTLLAQALNDFDTEIDVIDQEATDAIVDVGTALREFIDEAGVPLSTALENYTPPMDRLAAALETRNERIGEIDADETTALGEVDADFAAFVKASGTTLPEALANYTPPMTAMAAALEGFNTDASGILTDRENLLAGNDANLQAFITASGTTLPEALANYTPPMDRLAAALETRNERIGEIDADETTALGEVDADFAAFVKASGTTLPEALANYTPPMDRLAAALETRDERIGEIDADETTALGEVDADFAAFVKASGTTLPEALANYTPPMDRLAQALADFNERGTAINTRETEGISDIRADSVADTQGLVDAEGELSDQYTTDAQDAFTTWQADIRTINTDTKIAIETVNTTLKTELDEIDTTLSETLTAIRENKIAFDAQVFEDIRTVNRDAANDIALVKIDAAAQREAIEAVATEAKNNAWKAAMLKVANIGITITGVAAGAVLGGPRGCAGRRANWRSTWWLG